MLPLIDVEAIHQNGTLVGDLLCKISLFTGLGKEYALLLASRGAKIVGECGIIASYADFGPILICTKSCSDQGCARGVAGCIIINFYFCSE